MERWTFEWLLLKTPETKCRVPSLLKLYAFGLTVWNMCEYKLSISGSKQYCLRNKLKSQVLKTRMNTWSDLVPGEKVGPMCVTKSLRHACWFAQLTLSRKLWYEERMRVGQGKTVPLSSWTLYLSKNWKKYRIDTFSFHIFTKSIYHKVMII